MTEKHREEGSTLLAVTGIVALVTVAALAGMAGAGIPMKTVNMDRREMLCFYELETGINEVLEGLEAETERVCGEAYQETLRRLDTEYLDGDAAREGFLAETEMRIKELGEGEPEEYFKTFLTIPDRENFSMEWKAMEREENVIIFRESGFRLQDTGKGIEAEVRGDIVISLPDISFGEDQGDRAMDTDTEIQVNLDSWERMS